MLTVEQAIDVQGLRVEADAGIWNRGDRTVVGHKAVFKVDGLVVLRNKYPDLSISCEVYDDTSVHVYTTDMVFVAEQTGSDFYLSECDARCSELSPANFLDFKIVIDDHTQRLLQTQQPTRFHCVDPPSDLVYDSSSVKPFFYIDAENTFEVTGHNIIHDDISSSCHYFEEEELHSAAKALVV